MIEFFNTNGITSDRACIRVKRGVLIEDLTDPSNPVLTALNWIDEGYANGAPLTGLDSGGQNTLASLTITIVDAQGQVATIMQGGVPKPCNVLPFIILSVAPTVPIFIFNVPLVAGLYHCTVVFTKPTGEDAIINEFDLSVS